MADKKKSQTDKFQTVVMEGKMDIRGAPTAGFRDGITMGQVRDRVRRLGLGCFAAALLMTFSQAGRAEPKDTDAFAQNKKLGRGVNIIGYDPIWRSWDKGRLKEQHFRLLSEAGFNSVRIDLQVFNRLSATNNFQIPQHWFEVADWAVANARSNGLMAILDLQEFIPMGKDPEGNREKFLATWRQLSVHFRSRPEDVVFEILNEPNQKLTPALWNEYFAEV